jgi:hypothetical protein
MKHVLVPVALAVLCGAAVAKLPPPDDATKAKAAEAAAKAAWQGKVDGYLLCKAQDKVAAQYRKTSAKPSAAVTEAKPAAPVAAAAAPASAASGAQAAPPTGTPVAAGAAPPPCADPGPFAYNPPEQKPLETSGAHSPSGTAANPPSVRSPSAAMVPARKP